MNNTLELAEHARRMARGEHQPNDPALLNIIAAKLLQLQNELDNYELGTRRWDLDDTRKTGAEK